jgi:hypothetical protein
MIEQFVCLFLIIIIICIAFVEIIESIVPCRC